MMVVCALPFVFCLFWLALILGLKDVSVTIPQAVKRGSNALLVCNYDMENDTLYSVKWYKGRREFYRYTPKENPAMKVFPNQSGLNVEVCIRYTQYSNDWKNTYYQTYILELLSSGIVVEQGNNSTTYYVSRKIVNEQQINSIVIKRPNEGEECWVGEEGFGSPQSNEFFMGSCIEWMKYGREYGIIPISGLSIVRSLSLSLRGPLSYILNPWRFRGCLGTDLPDTSRTNAKANNERSYRLPTSLLSSCW